jgi:CHAD domain-containing protein
MTNKNKNKTKTKDKAVTLGEWANMAIAKHTRKIFKYEAGVLKDKDPEDLHQMRVGMRRLRSAIAGFAQVLELPELVTEKKIAKIGHSLGKLRDLDVLIAALTNDYRSLLPAVEQQSLDQALKSLNKQRKQELKQVRKTLDSKLYVNLKQGLQDWLEQPKYQIIADFSIHSVLPDLLLPQISQLLLHPGWLVGVELKDGQPKFAEIKNIKAVEQILERQEKIVHALRKSAKKTRYSLELFSQFYDDADRDRLSQVEQIQEVLGQIQDCYVLKEVLSKVLKSAMPTASPKGLASASFAIADEMPILATLIAQTRYQKWQEWQVLQQQFLETKTRKKFRLAVQ